jgi:hypothetical protein
MYVWRGNRKKGYWICPVCWRNIPTSKRKIIGEDRKKRYYGDKTQLASDVGPAICEVMSLFVGRKLPPNGNHKEDVVDSNKTDILALVKGMGNTKLLVTTSEKL